MSQQITPKFFICKNCKKEFSKKDIIGANFVVMNVNMHTC